MSDREEFTGKNRVSTNVGQKGEQHFCKIKYEKTLGHLRFLPTILSACFFALEKSVYKERKLLDFWRRVSLIIERTYWITKEGVSSLSVYNRK